MSEEASEYGPAPPGPGAARKRFGLPVLNPDYTRCPVKRFL